jgi:hypothetical protein
VAYAEKTGTYQQQERLKQRLTQISEAKESLSF